VRHAQRDDPVNLIAVAVAPVILAPCRLSSVSDR
jgi:hypothetical protein